MQNLYLVDNSNLDKEDKFAKVRPLIDKLNEQCLANYLPEQSVSVDDFMVPYFGLRGMRRVDHLDQNISSYMKAHRSKKWWWPVFHFCLDLSVNNAYQP